MKTHLKVFGVIGFADGRSALGIGEQQRRLYARAIIEDPLMQDVRGKYFTTH